MATRSHIGKKMADGAVKYIYCHFDGYPQHNGNILRKHYTDEAKIDELLKLGDLSYLSYEIGEYQDFERRETHNPEWCLAYGRDRGETNVKARIGNIGDFANEEYNYLWENGEWRCYTHKGNEIKF